MIYNTLITKIDDQCIYNDYNSNIFNDNNNRGKSPITNPLLIPTPIVSQ